MKVEFDNLEQRVLEAYRLLPPFVADKKAFISIEEQKALYDFFKSLYDYLFTHPESLFPKIREDYGFKNVFTSKGYGHDDIALDIRRDHTLMIGLMDRIRAVGSKGKLLNDNEITNPVKFTRKEVILLNDLGFHIDGEVVKLDNANLLKALVWFSKREEITYREFVTCSFDKEYDYLSSILSSLISKDIGACDLVIKWLEEHGYRRVVGCDKYDQFKEFIVNYVKNVDGKSHPMGFAYMGDKYYIGYSLEYRYTGLDPTFSSIRFQNFKWILDHFDELDDSLKDFVTYNTKKCDGCNYCVQLDKKNRTRAAVKCVAKDKTFMLCPLFPGFAYSFHELTTAEAKEIIKLLEINEKINLK